MIEQHRNALAALCRRFKVRRLDLFGSAAKGTFDPQSSDLDFLVSLDTSADSPAGRLQLNVLMAVAEFERGIIRERVSAGIIAAKAQWCKIRATSDHQQPGR